MPASKSSKHPIVKVEWVDAETEHGWKEVSDIEKMEGAACTTIGFLARKPTKKAPVYVIAATISYGDDGQPEFNAVHKIPKAWVTKVTEINDNATTT